MALAQTRYQNDTKNRTKNKQTETALLGNRQREKRSKSRTYNLKRETRKKGHRLRMGTERREMRKKVQFLFGADKR